MESYLCNLLFLAIFIQGDIFEIHPWCCVYQWCIFCCWIVYLCMTIFQVDYSFTCLWKVGLCPGWNFWKQPNTSVNTHLQVCVKMFSFLWGIRSRVTGLCCKCILSFVSSHIFWIAVLCYILKYLLEVCDLHTYFLIGL